MATMRLDFVSQDHMVFSEEVNEVLAPGISGQLGILPRHAPLITVLSPGEIVVRRTGQPDQFFAISGGWMEVQPDATTILARTAERVDEIDLTRAEAAKARAELLLAEGPPREDRTRLETALRRSEIRLKIARRHRGGRRGGVREDEGASHEVE